jgi:hypothetical protein
VFCARGLPPRSWPCAARVIASARSILFVKLAEQGSTVLAHAALRRAVDMVGRDNGFFVCLDDNRFILDALVTIPEQDVITIPSTGICSLLRGVLAAIGKLRRLKPKAVVDMEFFARGAVLAFLSGAQRRAGFH